jgi:hypothetical protein
MKSYVVLRDSETKSLTLRPNYAILFKTHCDSRNYLFAH